MKISHQTGSFSYVQFCVSIEMIITLMVSQYLKKEKQQHVKYRIDFWWCFDTNNKKIVFLIVTYLYPYQNAYVAIFAVL